MIWAIVQLSTKETQFFCVMKIIDGGVLPEFPIEEFEIRLVKNIKNQTSDLSFWHQLGTFGRL